MIFVSRKVENIVGDKKIMKSKNDIALNNSIDL